MYSTEEKKLSSEPATVTLVPEKPNKETAKAINDVEAGNTVRYDSFSSLLEEVDEETKKENPSLK